MIPNEAIDRLLLVPHAPGQGAWAAADCWGIVELWYRHVLGIDLVDRSDLPPGNESVQQWRDAGDGWERVAAPVDHAVVVMRAGMLEAGHVGVFYGGHVLHSAAGHGCVYQPISDRFIRAKTTGYLIRT